MINMAKVSILDIFFIHLLMLLIHVIVDVDKWFEERNELWKLSIIEEFSNKITLGLKEEKAEKKLK